ncbi:MAG TPA: flagellar biosynthesis protein FlhB [Geobacteraceae bacterium]|nr:flagellar biosynthesis protein FlhB [Geobacteraceae bacterium]
MADDKHSKTEQPTSKKLNEARKKGSPPQSRDLTSTITLLAGMVSLYASGGYMMSILKKNSRSVLSNAGTFDCSQSGIYMLMLKQVFNLAVILGPFLFIIMLSGIMSSIVQGGASASAERLTLKLDGLSPANGIKKIFRKESIFESVKSFIKIFIVGFVAYHIMKDEIGNVLFLTETDIQGLIEFVSHISFKIVLHTCGILLVLALLDYAFVKWRFIQNLKMTKQEVKDEHKESEGDPKIKGKIRRLQMEKAYRRLRQIIPTADVVVTNPTHFAVALKYDREKMAAPFVIAKGADDLAMRIKVLAKDNNVMLVENRFLARELYAQVKEGQEIPESLYVAVAELLAYVYSIKGMV